jgi:hypothetical protein
MSRVFIDNFESRNLNLWDTNNGCSIVSTAGLNLKGSYCVYGSNNSEFVRKVLPDQDEYWFAFQMRIIDVSLNTIFKVYNGGSQLISFDLDNTTHKIQVRNSVPSTIADGTKTYIANTTYFMQVYIKIADSGGRVLVKYDGNVDLDFTGDTKGGALSLINGFCLHGRGYFDNAVVDDSVMPEATEICLRKLNGIGNSSNWTPTSGNNYECVDEVPYSDADYVSEDVADAIDTYLIEDAPGDLVSVKCVQVQARARKDSDSLLGNMNLVLRSGGADYHSADKPLTTTFAPKINIWETNPADGQPFEKADIDALEIGERART